jgi:hypothetical protein
MHTPTPVINFHDAVSSHNVCSLPGSDHRGLSVSQGCGAPEIDIFEAEKDKDNHTGQVVLQSRQFVPVSHHHCHLVV